MKLPNQLDVVKNVILVHKIVLKILVLIMALISVLHLEDAWLILILFSITHLSQLEQCQFVWLVLGAQKHRRLDALILTKENVPVYLMHLRLPYFNRLAQHLKDKLLYPFKKMFLMTVIHQILHIRVQTEAVFLVSINVQLAFTIALITEDASSKRVTVTFYQHQIT